MRLGKVTSNDPMKREALSLHQSTVDQLQAYRAHYRSVHGDEISMSQMVEEMVKRFMRDDREFQKVLTTAAKPASVEAAPKRVA